MDIITKSHLDAFKESFGYGSLEDNEAFELFSIYSIASKFVSEDVITKGILEDIHIGGGADCGIDGFLLAINGIVVTDMNTAYDLIQANNKISVQIAIIQAKTSNSFDIGGLTKSLNGIEFVSNSFMGNVEMPSMNEDLLKYIDILKCIYKNSSKFYNNPDLYGCYVYCGVYSENQDANAVISKTKFNIQNTDLYNNFSYEIVDSKTIVKYYKNTKEQIQTKINIDSKLPLPKVDKVKDSYLCIVDFEELQKLYIVNDKIKSEVFNDNVRAFQGDNTVNNAMLNSLRSGNHDLFATMNNGITIIAENVQPTGLTMTLYNYQIVNGCQTCHVLYQVRNDKSIKNLKIVVKIIASEDKEVRDKIIVANNSQTEVKREQLLSLLDSQRRIEDYYIAQTKFIKLYYERRSKQYKSSDANVPQHKIITIPNQIKSFVSMILGKPEMVCGYYGPIVNTLRKDGVNVFSEDINPAFYYTSALAYYKMTELFSSRIIDKKYKKVQYQLLYAFRCVCGNEEMPNLESNKSQVYCDNICTILCDEEQCKQMFSAAANRIDFVLGREPRDYDQNKTCFTIAILKNEKMINPVYRGYHYRRYQRK